MSLVLSPLGFLWAFAFALPMGVLTAVRSNYDNVYGAIAGNVIVNFIVLLLVDGLVIYHVRPMTTFHGLLPLIVFNLLITLAVGATADTLSGAVSGASVVSGALFVVGLLIFWTGHLSGGNAYAAASIVHVTAEPADALPPSSTARMLLMSPGIAGYVASQELGRPAANGITYNTYTNLGPATLEPAFGDMQYVYPLEVDGAGNKARLHAVVPGYITVSGTNPLATAIPHFGGQFTMKIDLAMGQGAEPARWVYDHGYSNYLTDTPQFQVDPAGRPFWVVPLLTAHVGWNFFAPAGVALVNAHTGQITHYTLANLPVWVNRVYSEGMAKQIVTWYGKYCQPLDNGQCNKHAGFSTVGATNGGRYQVSGDPVQVWTGQGYPDYRMLLTSFNSDVAVSKIVIMNTRTGTMQVYTPQHPMGIESAVSQAFSSASGTGATLIKANHYGPTDLTLHMIYGHLTWMATYEAEGSNPSFVGLGFVDAYHAQANNVAFGDSKSAALQNYLTQLASQASANGNAPGQGGQFTTVSGVVASINWDITGGQKYWYIQLKGDPGHAYEGTVNAVGPALVEALPGQHVMMTFLKVNATESVRTMQSFTDTQVPLRAAGS